MPFHLPPAPDSDSFQETVLPHAWKGGIGCMVVGLAIMVLTVLLSILTPCFRHCCCCSVFTFSGSLQVYSPTGNFMAKLWLTILSKILYFKFRALLLCYSQWGWLPTLQGGDPQRFEFSLFWEISLSSTLSNLRLWKCVRTRTPLCLATARWEEPTGWLWPAPSAPSWPPPSPSSPTSPPRATRPCTGGRTGRSSSVCHETFTYIHVLGPRFKLVFQSCDESRILMKLICFVNWGPIEL